MKFQQCVSFLKLLKVEYSQESGWQGEPGVNRKSFPLNLFTGVRLPFSAEEWCNLCMSEGSNYVGGCCGTTSAAQDILNHCFRFDSGYISVRDLAQLADILGNHDENPDGVNFNGFKGSLTKLVTTSKKRWKKLDPWSKIALIWHITKQHFGPERPSATGKHLSEIETACSDLESGLRLISLRRVFASSEDKHKPPSSQQKVGRAITLAKIIPALNLVHSRVAELNLGTVEGFALMSKEQYDPKVEALAAATDAIASDRNGLCIFETKEKVLELIRLWEQQQKVNKDNDMYRKGDVEKTYGIRPVRVSMEKGLEFTGGFL